MRIRTLTAMYLLVSAFAIPASAGAYTDYSTVNSLTGDSAESSQPTSDPISVNAIVPPVSEANSSGSPSVGSDYASLNAVAGPPADTPASSPARRARVRDSTGPRPGRRRCGDRPGRTGHRSHAHRPPTHGDLAVRLGELRPRPQTG